MWNRNHSCVELSLPVRKGLGLSIRFCRRNVNEHHQLSMLAKIGSANNGEVHILACYPHNTTSLLPCPSTTSEKDMFGTALGN